MERGYAHNSNNPSHINLNFVGKVSPFCDVQTCCSCILVSPNHVLTAWHCLDSPCGDFCIQFPSGETNHAKDFVRIGKQDLAIGFLENPTTTLPLRTSSRLPQKGDIAILAGWGVNQNRFDLRFGFAAVTTVDPSRSYIHCGDRNSLAPKSTKGDSGGAIICHDGEDIFLAGTISKKFNRGVLLFSHLQTLAEYCPNVNNSVSKSYFDKLYKIEVNRRLMVEKGFNAEEQDDWIDVDRWLYQQLTSQQSE
jgi:hypothetical protein